MENEKNRDEKKSDSSQSSPGEEIVIRQKPASSGQQERSASSLPIPREVLPLSEDPKRCLNQYVLVEEIGRGGMGTVWRAWDTRLIRWVAVKFLSSTNEISIRRFEREAQLSAQLRHPNIASVHEVNEVGGSHFLVMDYVDGPSIGRAELDERVLLAVYVKICRAVQFAHDKSIIHRDIKPDNILMGKDGEPYVTDFGLAMIAQTESSLSLTGSLMGTPVFMSPEQAEGHHDKIDSRSDVYSLGATLYSLLTGHVPFEGEDITTILEKLAVEDPTPPTDLNSQISPELETILLKAMAKEKSARYPSAEDFARDLENFLRNRVVEAKKPGPLRPLLRKLKRHRWKWIALITIFAACGVWFFRSRTESPAVPVKKGEIPVEDQGWETRLKACKRKIAFYGFEKSSPEIIRETREVISDMPPANGRAVEAWFGKQVDKIPREIWPKKTWLDHQAEARQIRDWCGMIGMILDDAGGPFVSLCDKVRDLEVRFSVIADYRGTIVLRLLVWPYAELRSLRVGEIWVVRDGKKVSRDVAIPGESLFTPLEIRNLDIGDYRILLFHQELGEREFRLQMGDLKNGATYACSGSLRDPESIRLRLLP